MKENDVKRHFDLLDKRIEKLEDFIKSLEGATDLTDVDYKEIKNLIYMIKCQKERCKRYI